MMAFSAEPFVRRRELLASRLQPGVLILPTAPEVARNADSHYPYRFDSSFYYLTGFTEPEAVLVLVIEPGHVQSILFCRDKDTEREIWDGYRFGPEAAQEEFAMDAAYPIASLDQKLAEILPNQPCVYFALGQHREWDQRLTGWLDAVRAQVRSGATAPATIMDLRGPLDAQRQIKDATELDWMRRAARINCAAHERAMRACRPGMMEYELEAELLHDYYRQGSRYPAYSSIVAGGRNGCVLHYVENNHALNAGELVMIDAGCELEGYASDISRTFPVSGRFSADQKEVYEIVLAAQQAAMACCKPGASWNAPHEAAVRVLAQGLLDLGLLSGSLDTVLETESYKQFYMHRTGHWLGLDVHDVGAYKHQGDWLPLSPGMVLTVEPGLYIRPAPNVPDQFANIGIRIEDNVLITDAGYENLTAACPKSVAEIEALMGIR